MSGSNGDKRVIGLYGEMRLAMELHKRGWQVYSAYIDDKFDFVILKSYCENCKTFKDAWTREETYINKKGKEATGKTVTQLCETCLQDSLKMLVRFIQVKTSEGVSKKTKKSGEESRKYSFHAKIRYHLADSRIFYAWIQVWDEDNVNYYIFKTADVKHFDDLQLASYQITDSQKTTLTINKEGELLTKGTKHDYSAFEEFHDNFECLEDTIDGDPWK